MLIVSAALTQISGLGIVTYTQNSFAAMLTSTKMFYVIYVKPAVRSKLYGIFVFSGFVRPKFHDPNRNEFEIFRVYILVILVWTIQCAFAMEKRRVESSILHFTRARTTRKRIASV